MAEDVQLQSITIQEEMQTSEILRNASFQGITLQQDKIFDLEIVRNKTFLGGITLYGRVLTPDVIVGEPVFH